MTLVVFVCSPSTVITANGSGSRKTSRLDKPSAATTVTQHKEWGQLGYRIEEQTYRTCYPDFLLAAQL